MQILCTLNIQNSTKRHKAVLLIKEPDQEEGSLFLAVDDGREPYEVKIAYAEAPIAGTDWRVTLSDGNILHFPSDSIIAELKPYLPVSASRWQNIHRFEQVNVKGLFFVLLLIIGILYGFRQSIVPIGDFTARLISPKHEQIIGNAALTQIDSLLFNNSKLTSEVKQRIKQRFDAIVALEQSKQDPVKLVFRSAPAIGPNAFALPGNIIVLLDEMVNFVDDDDLIIAVLAHEYAHVSQRHAMRQITRNALLTAIAAVIFGADESMLEELASVGGGLALAKYSREFELEADQYSGDIMLQLGLDPKKILELFDLIEAKCEGTCDGGSFFASHPSFADRRSHLSQY